MSLILFFARRILGGFIARLFIGFLTKRFGLAAGAASLLWMVITEVLARSSEKAVSDRQIERAAKKAK